MDDLSIFEDVEKFGLTVKCVEESGNGLYATKKFNPGMFFCFFKFFLKKVVVL